MATNVSMPSDAQYYPSATDSTTSASRTDTSADTVSSSSNNTPIYTPTGNIVFSSPNWNRYFDAKIYAHTEPQVQFANSTGSNQSSMQAFAQQQDTDVVLDVSNLRCVFQAQHYALYYPNICHLTVYNLNAQTEKMIILEGYRLVIEAGYWPVGSPKHAGQIFDGNIIQCTRSRNGPDMLLNILAMDGSMFYQVGYCNFQLIKGQSMRDVVNTVSQKASVPIDIGYASPQLDNIKLQKGLTAHGKPEETLNDIARSINGTWFVEGGKLYVVAYSDSASKLPLGLQAVVLTPDTGLLGNPEQNGQGVNARSLLNSSIMIYGLVNIPNELITEQMVQPGSYSGGIGTKYSLDTQSVYRVISVNHNGDTRDNAWYSDIVTVSQTGNISETLTLN